MSYIWWKNNNFEGYWHQARFKDGYTTSTTYKCYASFDGTGTFPGGSTSKTLNNVAVHENTSYWVFILKEYEEKKIPNLKANVLITAYNSATSNPDIHSSAGTICYIPSSYLIFQGNTEYPQTWGGENFYNIKYELNGGYFQNGYNAVREHDREGGIIKYQIVNPKKTYFGTYGSNDTGQQMPIVKDGRTYYINYHYLWIDHPVRSGHTFQGWTISNIASNGAKYWASGEQSFENGGTYSIGTDVKEYKNLQNSRNATVTFTARWDENYTPPPPPSPDLSTTIYNIEYVLDGGYFLEGTNAYRFHNPTQRIQAVNPTRVCYHPSNGSIDSNQQIALSNTPGEVVYSNYIGFYVSIPQKDGYIFKGWKATNIETGYFWPVGGPSWTAWEVSNPEWGYTGSSIVSEFYNLRSNGGTVTFIAVWQQYCTINYFFYDNKRDWTYYKTVQYEKGTNISIEKIPEPEDDTWVVTNENQIYWYVYDGGPTNTYLATAVRGGIAQNYDVYTERRSHLVKIGKTGGIQIPAIPYIYCTKAGENIPRWHVAIPYIYTGSEWKITE